MKYSLKITIVVSLFAFIAGCGGGGSTGPNTNPDAPVLSPIGNKTVTTGNALTFAISATDPNGLPLTYDTDGSAGSGPNPYTDTGNTANFNSNTRQFSWDTTNVSLGDYYVEFSVMNSAGLADREQIRIRIEAVQPPADQFTTGQTLYNNNCRGSGCHRNEDANLAEGAAFGILCTTESAIKAATESGPGVMPTFDFTSEQEAAIAYYLANVRPADC